MAGILGLKLHVLVKSAFFSSKLNLKRVYFKEDMAIWNYFLSTTRYGHTSNEGYKENLSINYLGVTCTNSTDCEEG